MWVCKPKDGSRQYRELEAELKAGAWFVVSAEKSLIFGKDADKKWQQAVDQRKIPL